MTKPTATVALGDNLASSLTVIRDAYPFRVKPSDDPPDPVPTDEQLLALAAHYLATVLAAHPEAICREQRTDPHYPPATHPGIRCGTAAAQLMGAGKEHLRFMASLTAARQRPRTGLVGPDNRPINSASGPALLVPEHLAGKATR